MSIRSEKHTAFRCRTCSDCMHQPELVCPRPSRHFHLCGSVYRRVLERGHRRCLQLCSTFGSCISGTRPWLLHLVLCWTVVPRVGIAVWWTQIEGTTQFLVVTCECGPSEAFESLA